MFGFQGGESADTIARKKGYMQDAQRRWGFMTNFDLSTIKNEVQLSSMVKERSGIAADIRRFGHAINKDEVFGTHSPPRVICR
jgi:hypothetical protein